MTEAPVAEKKEAAKENRVALVSVAYPEREGFKRKICPLWGPYLRINFINLKDGTVPESHFLMAKNGKVEVIGDG
jgi:hypothetical protein